MSKRVRWEVARYAALVSASLAYDLDRDPHEGARLAEAARRLELLPTELTAAFDLGAAAVAETYGWWSTTSWQDDGGGDHVARLAEAVRGHLRDRGW